MNRPIHLRPRAEDDLVEISRYYAQSGGLTLGERFFDEAMAALDTLSAMPGIGSPRASELSGVVGLRSWAVKGFPVRWFYLESEGHLDVIRLLGERQDLAAILSEAGL